MIIPNKTYVWVYPCQYGMATEHAREAHVQGLLWFYSHVGSDQLDIATVVATFCVPPEPVRVAFDELADRGYVRSVDEDTFKLTDAGQNAAMKRGGSKVPA